MRLHAKRAVLLRKGHGKAVKYGMQPIAVLQDGPRPHRLPLPERLKGIDGAFFLPGDDAVADLLPQYKGAQQKMIAPPILAFGRNFALRLPVHA